MYEKLKVCRELKAILISIGRNEISIFNTQEAVAPVRHVPVLSGSKVSC